MDAVNHLSTELVTFLRKMSMLTLRFPNLSFVVGTVIGMINYFICKYHNNVDMMTISLLTENLIETPTIAEAPEEDSKGEYIFE